MEGKKKPAAATGSSLVDDLFGPKDVATSSPSSAAGYFSAVFPAPSAAMGKDASPRRAHGGGGGGRSSSSSAGPGAGAGAGAGQEGKSLYGGSPESPYFGSTSVHYGGRDFYAAESHRQYPAAADHQKHKEAGDKQQDTPAAATRGDWWQGSLYY